MRPIQSASKRSLLLPFVNVAVVALSATAVIIHATGGGRFTVYGVPVSFHSAWRAAAAAAALCLVRIVLFGLEPSNLPGRIARRVARRLGEAARWSPPPSVPLFGRHSLWALLGLCGFAVVFLHSQLTAMQSVPDLGDPLFSIWRMGWVYHWLHGGDPRPLFSPNIFYPTPLTLTFSDSILLPSLMAVPLMAVGLGPVVTYNVIFMSGLVLSGFSMYLLTVRLTGTPRAAFLAALLFAFYPFRFEHYSHLELQMTEWAPLTLLGLHSYLETWNTKYAIATALAVVAQLYSSMYIAAYLGIFVVPIVACYGIVRRPRLRQLWPGSCAAVFVVAALAAPLARPYMAAQSIKGVRGIAEVTYYSATLRDYLRPNIRSATYHGRLIRDSQPERALFTGLVAPILGGLAVAPPLGLVEMAYGAAALCAFDASFGFHGSIYPALYRWLPPFRGMRVPARFSLLFGMALCVLSGFGYRRLMAWCSSHVLRRVLFVALLGAVTVDLMPTLHLEPVWPNPPAIYGLVAHLKQPVLAEFPIEANRDDVTPNVPYMYFSLWHWADMVNGYSGFTPANYGQFLMAARAFPSAASAEAMRREGVTHVTVNCALYGAGCEALVAELDGSPDFRKLAMTSWQGDPAYLYALGPKEGPN